MSPTNSLVPEVAEPSQLVVEDAVIEEARARARRRRRRYAVTAVVVAAVISAGVFVTLDRTPPSPGSTTTGSTSAVPATDDSVDCFAPGRVPGYSATTRHDASLDDIGGPVGKPQGKDRPCWLVLGLGFHNSLGPLTGHVWLLSDGRIISWWDPVAVLMEQRLTAEGVELVRTMAISLVTDVRPARWADPRTCRPNERPACHGTIRYQGQTQWMTDYSELSIKLFDLSWLPDSAWLSQEPQPYRPNWWTACYGGRAPADGEIWPGNYPLDRQRVLHRLPHEAAALLRDKHTTTVPITWNHDTGEHGESTQYCTVVSATDRQVIINALGDPISAATQEGVPLGRIDGYPAELGFGPLLPTGKGVCFCA